MDDNNSELKLDLWRLCDGLTVVQAALLVIGKNPSEFQGRYLPDTPKYRPDGFDAAFTALKNAIVSGKLDANIIYSASTLHGVSTKKDYQHMAVQGDKVFIQDKTLGNVLLQKTPDWDETTIVVEDLKNWLVTRGLRTGFFFDNSSNEPDYLNRNHPHYCNKLEAAIRAWEAVTNEPAYKDNGKTVKKNLENWLTANASKFGLMRDDGSINSGAIEDQISKVANWHEKGGVSKTPTS